ncbi:DEAD/DEAH box helicase [Serinibacter arcticus]|uniref:Putative helicase n=1 Tax=Serinibacter arcticus TaxID=1655435 RepID=A0A4Z1E6G9_9MICO|nr:DEAD/DEAH box helicase [Serinibacter arcticus]TGO05181.1 putative helicase [Serinibacter arcticus]
MHAPIELVGLVGRHAFDAGISYARQHRAVVRRHDAEARVVVGSVDGSGRQVYTATTYYGFTRNGTVDFFDGRCSCPVQTDCKHTVALLVTALEQERTAAARTVVVSQWRSQLEGIFPDTSAQQWSPLALSLQFTPPPTITADRRGGLGGYRAVHEGALEARAMRLGKRGQWIATGAEWHAVTRAGISDADPAQLDALAALVRLHQASDVYAYGVPTWLGLQTVPSRALWPVLRDVVESGVRLLEVDGEDAVLSDVAAQTAVTVSSVDEDEGDDGGGRADDGGPDLEVTATMDHPSTLTETLLLGRPAHGFVGRDPHGTLTLVPLQAPATRAWVDLRRAGTIQVPASERPLFERTILPRIQRETWHAAGDFAPETPPGPTLVVRVRLLWTALGSSPRASIECEWRYGEADNPFALTFTLPADPRRPDRDGIAENVLLHRAAAAMAALPTLLSREGLPLEEMVVTGHAVVALVEEVVPALLQVEGIEVDLPEEDLPTFRDLGDPEIAVDVVGTNRDWFDLEVRLRVTDRDVPVGHVITALARREQTLFLEDGGYISLDRPELDQLRALLEEGRALQDQRRTGLRVSRLNLSWWEELQALGVIDHQAQEWLDRVRAATSLDGEAPPLPAGLRADLRPYQRAGYEWLARLRRAGLGGVLADDMGLGKTLQTLAMILDAKDSGALTAPVPGAGSGTGSGEGATARHRPFVVVAPTSVVPNWAVEAERFAPDLRVAVVTATGKKRRESIAELAAQADVIVTSYALFRLEHDEYEALVPAGLVLDEAQNIKNRTSRGFALAKTLPADVKFVVTGTPMENNLAELWAMFAIAAPGLLGTPQQFTELYSAPIERGNGAELGLFERLRTRIAPFLLRRTKEEVTPDLPPKQEQILSVTLDPAHRKVYARHLGRERQRVLGLVSDMDRNRVEVLSALTRLRQLAIDASLVDEEYAGVPSSKLDVLMPLLTEAAAEGHRALVFSQFTRYLAKIAARLDAEGIPYAYLDGSTTKRAAVIRGFAEGTQPVFLISLKAGGVGLNLAMADYCILADPWWNPAAEAQAVDRAHRIGQTRPVMVYRMVAADTIEEKVMALQDSKRALVAGVLGGGGAAGAAVAGAGGASQSRLDADDIRALLD